MKTKLITLFILAAIFLNACTVYSCNAHQDFQYGNGWVVSSCTVLFTDGDDWPAFRILNLSRYAKK